MRRAVAIAVLALGGCGDGYFFGDPPPPAPEPTVPFERVAVIGASVSAGMGGGPIAQVIEARVDGAEVLDAADVRTFEAPVRKLEQQVVAAVEHRPTAVVAIDALFWCGYGGGGRLARLRRCLDIIGRIDAPLFLGDLPDMRNAAGWMLPPPAVPTVDELRALNGAIGAWASGRDNVRIVPLSEWNQPLLDGDRELRQLMSPDGLHPNRGGLVYLLRKLAREVDGAGALGGI